MRNNYSDKRRDFARKEFNSTSFGKELVNRYRSDYSLKIGLYELDDSLYTSYLSLNHAATSLCCCRKTLRNVLCMTAFTKEIGHTYGAGKLFRKRWYIRHLPPF